VRAESIASIDRARPLARLRAADLRDENRLNGGEDTMRYAVSQGVFGTACVQNGIAMRLLEMTLEYVKDREQFGRPVGSFQAIKHKLADMHTALASSRPAAWYAGYALATNADDASEAAAVAKVAASETEALCNREALQCHGGIGFTWEHDLHLWLKRGITLRSTFGDASLHRRGLANRLLAT
jgi:alkylation response protein AidB-like acyl-CoA dehydrogenase